VVRQLVAKGLPVIVVDDGSTWPAREAIAALHAPAAGIHVLRNETNLGKGGAVLAGFQRAAVWGYTHALQIDADGQHDLDALDALLDAARADPDALVLGVPIFDASIPMGRRIGKKVTNVWVWIETLSTYIRDAMCGFRIYPLGPSLAIASAERIGLGMDFDVEIAVRLAWRGTPISHVPVQVIYPADNHSNFRMWADNVRISTMHARLFFGMLARLPTVLRNRHKVRRADEHWSSLRERGAYWGISVLAAVLRTLGFRACRSIMVVVVAYFWMTGSSHRQASKDYLRRVLGRAPSARDTFRHFLSFADRTLEAFAAWIGAGPPTRFRFEDGGALEGRRRDPRGLVLVVSHFGNIELLRANMDDELRRRMLVLVHSHHAALFNRQLTRLQPLAALNTIQVTEVGADTVMRLADHVEAGGWVVIAGDRTPVGGRERVSRVEFLGEPAPFPQGPYLLAGLLKCPVYALFCARTHGYDYQVSFERISDGVDLTRRAERDEAFRRCAATFAQHVEIRCRQTPWGWYNFFDFWGQ
jgi:predicted LPLAT superfamily acyltransferase